MFRAAARVGRSLTGHHRWWAAALLAATIAAVSAWLAFLIVPAATVHVGVVSAQISAAPGSGTVIRAVEGRSVTDATTTRGPLQVRVDVAFHPSASVHEPQVLAGLGNARNKLVRAVITYLLRVTVVAAATAAGIAMLLFGRARRAIGAAAATVLVVGTGAAATAGTVRPAAFDAASCVHGWSRYALADLPDLTPPAPRVRAPLDATVADNPGLVPVELIADNHLNPEGLKFALNLAHQTGVRAVLDAGDTTSYGVPGEDCVVLPLIRQFHVPYVWVRGNHDSAAFAHEMRHVPGVRALADATATIAGITVFGDADPSFTPHAEQTTVQIHAADATARAAMPAQLAALTVPPDVVLVHDCLMATSADPASRGAIGLVPLIACGHLHRFSESTLDGTTVLHTGTVGAGGIAALQTGQLRCGHSRGRQLHGAADNVPSCQVRSTRLRRRTRPSRRSTHVGPATQTLNCLTTLTRSLDICHREAWSRMSDAVLAGTLSCCEATDYVCSGSTCQPLNSVRVGYRVSCARTCGLFPLGTGQSTPSGAARHCSTSPEQK